MSWHNEYRVWLTEAQSLDNAQLVADHFNGSDWSKESISAMVGNMRHESSVNPNMYEYGWDWADDKGFGLVQWTPRSKYWDWALANGYAESELRDGDAQLARLDYEVDNNIQYIPNGHQARYGYAEKYNFSFADFRTNAPGLSVGELTEAFMWNYEGPRYDAGTSSLAERQAFANRVYNTVSFEGGGGSDTDAQLAVLPIDVIYVLQGEYGSFSHYEGSSDELAIDFIGYGPDGKINTYPLYAPFDCEVIAVYPDYAQVVWKNTRPVMGANGTLYNDLVLEIVHDWNYNTYTVGQTAKKGELFHRTGNATGPLGTSTEDHLHFQVLTSDSFVYPTPVSVQGHIYEIFDTKHCTIYNDGGYTWLESDYQDGGGDPGGGGEDPDQDHNTLLMILNGRNTNMRRDNRRR